MKIKILITAFLLCLLNTAIAQTLKKNIYMFSYFKDNGKDGLHLAYSKNGLDWKALKRDSSFLKPVLSKDSLMRDPCIIKGVDGIYHMVWTVSWKAKGIGYATSKDLINWSAQKYIPVMEQEKEARNCWAPELTWNNESKQYIIYWSTTIKGLFEDPELPNRFGNRIYYTTTKNFEDFTPTKLLYDPGFNIIDAHIVKDGSRWLMFFKDEREKPLQKNIKIAFANHITGPYSEAGLPITAKTEAEGPTSLKIKNRWILYYDKFLSHSFGAMETTDLINWSDISLSIKLPNGIRHGTIFTVKKRELKKLLKI